MPEPPTPYEASEAPPSRGSVFATLISAALFLWVGFGLGLVGVSESAFYNASVTVFVWTARIVGIGLLMVAALVYARVPGALMLDLVMGALAAASCLIVGAIWVAYGTMVNGVLLLIFGAYNANAVRGAWEHWRRARRVALDHDDSAV